MFKRLCTLVLTLTLIFGLSTVAVAAEQVKIKFNGKNLTTDVNPIIRQSRTLVPIGAISEALGADVTYENATRQITIIKGQDTYALTVNKREVLKNGQKLQQLDVPPRTVNGRPMIPARFISEVLGAKVEWDNNTFTVSITHEEKRNGLSPVELYTKVSEAVYKQESIKYQGKGTITAALPDVPTLSFGLGVDGAFKKPQEVWASVYLKPGIELKLAGIEPVAFEIYASGLKSYYKQNGVWTELPATPTENLPTELLSYDPSKSAELLEKFGFILSHGNEATIDGKTYDTLNIRLDQTKLLTFINDMLASTPAASPGLTPEQAKEAQKVFKDAMKEVKFDFSYKIFIDKDTLLINKGHLNGTVRMDIQGENVSVKFDLIESLTYGLPVTMPDVNKK